MQYNSLKTLGGQSARLFTELNERRATTFTVADARSILGSNAAAARSLIAKARRRGLVTQLKPGLYNLVPFELGRTATYAGDPYLIARSVVGDAPYFLSHATAFELHRMSTQPHLEIFVSSPKRFRPQTIGGYRYRFVYVPEARFFGASRHWVTKDQSVNVSDLERTVIDGLCRPEYVGGMTEVTRGIWMQREQLQIDHLVAYAVRLGVGAVASRLGFILERYELANAAQLGQLRACLGTSYHRFDPLLPAEGRRNARWRVQLNVALEELDAVRFG